MKILIVFDEGENKTIRDVVSFDIVDSNKQRHRFKK